MGRKRKEETIEAVANSLQEEIKEAETTVQHVEGEMEFDFDKEHQNQENKETAAQAIPIETCSEIPSAQTADSPSANEPETDHEKLERLETELLLLCKKEMLLKTLMKSVRDSKKKHEDNIMETMNKIKTEQDMPLLQAMLAMEKV